MSKNELRRLRNDMVPENLFDYLQVVKELYVQDENLRDFSGNLHKMRQNMAVLDRTRSKNVRILQFTISGASSDLLINFWIEIIPDEDVFEVGKGVHAAPFVIYNFHELALGMQMFEGLSWLIKKALNTEDPRLTVNISGRTDLSLQRLCSELLINFIGVLNDCYGFYWSDPKI